mmetsp:Transcript_27161/g.56910  ORF Transcript_27161/g.56910 Transcript_27161/m.56910 type:complete len:306 (-) Transcript_27161:530-1447(-)
MAMWSRHLICGLVTLLWLGAFQPAISFRSAPTVRFHSSSPRKISVHRGTRSWRSSTSTPLKAARLNLLRLASLSSATSSENDLDSQECEKHEIVPKTLPQAFRIFFLDVYNGPRLIVAILLALVAMRLHLVVEQPHLQALSSMDAAAAGLSVVFWWFQEHVLHKHLLHSPFDWYGKAIHEGHHDKPYFHISIDPAGLMFAWLGAVHVFLRLCLPLPLALSATLGYATAGLWYEYLHFIVHTKVRFRRNSYWETMKTHHARHHLVDKANWLGFSIPAIDSLFGTNPPIETVTLLKKNKPTTNDISP